MDAEPTAERHVANILNKLGLPLAPRSRPGTRGTISRSTGCYAAATVSARACLLANRRQRRTEHNHVGRRNSVVRCNLPRAATVLHFQVACLTRLLDQAPKKAAFQRHGTLGGRHGSGR